MIAFTFPKQNLRSALTSFSFQSLTTVTDTFRGAFLHGATAIKIVMATSNTNRRLRLDSLRET